MPDTHIAPEVNAQREAFYERIGHDNLTPLWTSLANLVTPEPISPCRPAAWRFDTIRAAMIEAGALITAKEAERRVLVLENPGLARPQSRITTRICMPACNWCCPARSPRRIAIRSRPCASCWKATAPTPPSTARRP